MADVRWRLLALIVVVMATKTQAIDQNVLGTIVKQVLQRLHLNGGLPMFSVAVRVPLGSNSQYDVAAIPDPGDNIKNAILKCRVYEGEHVVAATLLRWPDVLKQCPEEKVPWEDVLKVCKQSSMTWQQVKDKCPNYIYDNRADHAEYRVLNTFKKWVDDKEKTGLMLFYVFASPCTNRCTHENNELNILKLVENINQWPQHVLVFSKVFQPKGKDPIEVEKLKAALSNLGDHLGKGGLGNIFRCDREGWHMKCVSCSGGGGEVTPHCYQNEQDQYIQEGGSRGGNVRWDEGGQVTPNCYQSGQDQYIQEGWSRGGNVRWDVGGQVIPNCYQSEQDKKTDKGGGAKRGRG
ncbi:uncharacterized protein LOC133634262 [Entelurus aequoreus]|uniref:uncharacterized protein LOC133634262 n=1 Tax=Entelurus aequoreus TaxID=161455 RepID=UPI002B1E0651|nr:uncharacterized protein LOC133634262 [Entelurus aequoreus]